MKRDIFETISFPLSNLYNTVNLIFLPYEYKTAKCNSESLFK